MPMTTDDARVVFLEFEGAYESEHMGHPDFRVSMGIFATLWPDKGRAVLRLTLEMAEALAAGLPEMYRVVGRSGGMGWLGVELELADSAEFEDLASKAHELRSVPRRQRLR
jgi:hypothetical protein